MPYKQYDSENSSKPDLELPRHLEHKPIYATPYQRFDGIYGSNSDAKYLSVGLAQWNNSDLSVKVMRHTGNRWTRQAEEFPLHRVFDAANFLAKVLLDIQEDTVDIKPNTFTNQSVGLLVKKENINKQQQEIFEDFMNENKDFIINRLDSLYETLKSLKSDGKF